MQRQEDTILGCRNSKHKKNPQGEIQGGFSFILVF
jgi:hypothetical protein